METHALQVEIKKEFGSRVARRYRRSGLVPAILYGHKQESLMLLLSKKEFAKALDSGVKMVNLQWDSSGEIAIIKEVQFDTFGKEILHADFVRMDMSETVATNVPIELYGTSRGVQEGGILDHAMKEVEIECLAGEIPESIRINIENLTIGKSVHVKDVELPSGVKILDNPDIIVVSVHFVAEEKELSEEELAAGPEVITSRKPEEE
ncbi:MAG: 50S ribosomal protein L25 [Candidatus Scalindua sp. AMX11]|nr:MAG: 50S ribosomal protein L25 [Candidatus Scalindua sp.]NOG85270.1 50S ribosomal protein L25 [Planctomycetota bacterium]RZV81511.1 MAG: 50S ribosomal protein L25 [Candidatus Scalindua sp. SCAELEC01]TDE65416.1 MAG: 50S ribosomal protein L25 [Candidatus Scalindua sp. AMX11]GJQ59338.1 MAG: 50S ribosomal protein L25 [Candidatus Scalindua sp.]